MEECPQQNSNTPYSPDHQYLSRTIAESYIKEYHGFSHRDEQSDRSCVVKKTEEVTIKLKCVFNRAIFLSVVDFMFTKGKSACINPLVIEILLKESQAQLLMIIWDCCALTFWWFLVANIISVFGSCVPKHHCRVGRYLSVGFQHVWFWSNTKVTYIKKRRRLHWHWNVLDMRFSYVLTQCVAFTIIFKWSLAKPNLQCLHWRFCCQV